MAAGTIPVDRHLLVQLQQLASSSKPTDNTSSSAQHKYTGSSGSQISNGSHGQTPADSHHTPEITAAKIDAQDEFRDPPEPPPGTIFLR